MDLTSSQISDDGWPVRRVYGIDVAEHVDLDLKGGAQRQHGTDGYVARRQGRGHGLITVSGAESCIRAWHPPHALLPGYPSHHTPGTPTMLHHWVHAARGVRLTRKCAMGSNRVVRNSQMTL